MATKNIAEELRREWQAWEEEKKRQGLHFPQPQHWAPEQEQVHEAVIICSCCQHENPARARFCTACGATLNLVCLQCGHLNPPGSRFCNECGQTLTSSSETTLASKHDEPAELASQYTSEGVSQRKQQMRISQQYREVAANLAFGAIVGALTWLAVSRVWFSVFSTQLPIGLIPWVIAVVLLIVVLDSIPDHWVFWFCHHSLGPLVAPLPEGFLVFCFCEGMSLVAIPIILVGITSPLLFENTWPAWIVAPFVIATGIGMLFVFFPFLLHYRHNLTEKGYSPLAIIVVFLLGPLGFVLIGFIDLILSPDS